MSTSGNRLSPDVWLGGIVAAAGAWAAHESASFDQFSWAYPFTLSLATALLGVAIAVRALFRLGEGKPLGDMRVFAQGVLAGAVVLAAWILALDGGLGYLGPTLVAAIAVLWIAGVRDRKRLLVNGVGVTAGVFILFGILFATPLPVFEPLQALLYQ